MDVTALTQVKSESLKATSLILVDKEAFAEEMSISIAQTDLKNSQNSSKDQSQSVDETEERDVSDEDDISFTLIHPFLRLQTEIDSLSKGSEFKILHIDNNPMDNQLFQVLIGYMSLHDETSQSPGDYSETLEQVTSEISSAVLFIDGQDKLKTSDLIVDTESSIDMTNLIQVSQEAVDVMSEDHLHGNTDTKVVQTNELMMKDEEHTDVVGNDSATYSDYESVQSKTELSHKANTSQMISYSAAHESDSLVENQLPDALNSETSETDDSALIKIMEDLRITRPSQDMKPGEDTVIAKVNPLVDEVIPVTSETKQSNKDDFGESTIQTLSVDRQNTNSIVHSTDAKPIPVTRQQSLEIIQDLIMTAVTDENGKEIFKSTLTLTPEKLGEVKIELTYNQDGLSGKLIFDSDETKKWMESQWQQLKQPLETKGILVNQFNFSVTEQAKSFQPDSFSFSQQFDQSDNQAPKENSQSSKSKMSTDMEEEPLDINHTLSRSGLNIYV